MVLALRRKPGLRAGCASEGLVDYGFDFGRSMLSSRATALSAPVGVRRVCRPIEWPGWAQLLLRPSSLLHGLGCGRRVKANPADAGRFASLDTVATAKGGQLRGGRRRSRTGASQGRPGRGRYERCNLATVTRSRITDMEVPGSMLRANQAGTGRLARPRSQVEHAVSRRNCPALTSIPHGPLPVEDGPGPVASIRG